jgi:hypothetical protein
MSELTYINDPMKQNTFYILAGIVGLIDQDLLRPEVRGVGDR